MQEEIRKMDQAVANSSKLMKDLRGADTQYVAVGRAIADFWDRDIPQGEVVTTISSYPSLESLDEKPKEELTDTQYEYYATKGRF